MTNQDISYVTGGTNLCYGNQNFAADVQGFIAIPTSLIPVAVAHGLLVVSNPYVQLPVLSVEQVIAVDAPKVSANLLNLV